jgi:cytochrome c oxidase cbb3-type subunit III
MKPSAARCARRLLSQSWRAAVVLFVICSAWVEGSHAQNANATDAAAKAGPSEGRQLFETICAGCHGLDGRGGERGPDIATRQQIVQLSDAEILEILRTGRPAAGMPPFESFGNVKLKELLDHLRTLQGKGTNVSVAGDPHNGKALFFGKARCSECHMVRGEGGFIGRDLSAYGATLSPAEIRANILKSGTTPNKANRTAIFTMRDSKTFTGVIRNEDNFSIQLQSFDGVFHFLNRADVAKVDFQPTPIMPTDYSTTLKPAELDDLINYLVTVAKTGSKRNQEESDDED